ncbi:MAG: hypothetical protein K2N48_12375 [Muribaculaceae bacterium]|nr:hypothetical protein [Muribaculaceae bacterium]
MIKSGFISLRPVDRIVSAVFLLIISMAMGCSAIFDGDGACPEPEESVSDNGTVSIIFRVSTDAEMLDNPAWSTRADLNNHDEEDSDNPLLEDYISLADCGIFIFGGNDNPYLLYSNTDVTNNADGSDDFFISGSIGDYTIALTLDNSMVENIFGKEGDNSELSPNGERKLKLTVAILANISGQRNNPGNYDAFKNLKSVMSLKSDISYDIESAARLKDFIDIAQALTYTAATSQSNLRIPMYGLRTFTVSEKDMFYSRPDSRIELGNISLLRAMMKLRIVDNIQQRGEDGYPKLTGATLSFRARTGYVTPENAGSYTNGQQVHTDRVINAQDESASNIGLWKGAGEENTFVCCAPTQSITSSPPVLTIWAQRDADSEPQEFEVIISPSILTGITDADKWGVTMLRNHVYTLSVNQVIFGAKLNLTATVADWDDAPAFNFDYSDDVSSFADGKITWRAGSYAGIINETSLIMLPWHDGESVPAECTFGLSTPLGALWTASLIYESGDPGAFRFVDEDGNPFTDEDGNVLNTVEGRINGKLATLRIATTTETPSENNSVRLQIVVVTQGGNGFTIATDGKILLSWTLIQNKISD